MDHDNSMLVPEVWCRMRVFEREPKFLIDNGLLERVDNFEYEGRIVLASRLGYRITPLFVDRFLGRIFELPGAVFPEELLRPEKQDMACFAAGVEAICEAQRKVALDYFEDGSVDAACPPIKALLHIMAFGNYEGRGVSDPAIRGMFTRDTMLASDWYQERLRVKQQRDIDLWRRHLNALTSFAASEGAAPMAGGIDVEARLKMVRENLKQVSGPQYLTELVGTIGADPFRGQTG
jgi:hypothetical protein